METLFTGAPKTGDAPADSSVMLLCADSAFMAFDIDPPYQLANDSKAVCDLIAVPYSTGNWALFASGDSLIKPGFVIETNFNYQNWLFSAGYYYGLDKTITLKEANNVSHYYRNEYFKCGIQYRIRWNK